MDGKSAYLVGGGLAGLAAAIFLIRDGQMKGDRIHILEELDLPGGSLDGTVIPHDGFVTRGGREMENHFECLWDLFRSVPSLEVENASVLDEFYWLAQDDPNSSNCRIIHNRGQRAADDGDFTLSKKAQKELVELWMAAEDTLEGKTIEDVFTEDFFSSNFWLYWCTMFAFERWHSAIEMRRYIMRFVHHIKGLPDFTALKFTRYNQYDSLVKPMIAFLEGNGVHFEYGDRPLVVPKNSKNLAFIGNFAETVRDTVFTTEYSVRTAMEAVYQLLGVERGVPEVFASAYDLRTLANAIYHLSDRKKLTEMDLPFVERKIVEGMVHKTQGTYIGDILKEENLV